MTNETLKYSPAAGLTRAVNAPVAAALGKSKCDKQFRTLFFRSIGKYFIYLTAANDGSPFPVDLRSRGRE
jgi:hypothetical protein